MILASGEWGKTRTGAKIFRQLVDTGQAPSIALIGRTVADAHNMVVEGPSGILAVYPPHLRPIYEPSKRTETFQNGVVATTFSGDNPDHAAMKSDASPHWQTRGPLCRPQAPQDRFWAFRRG